MMRGTKFGRVAAASVVVLVLAAACGSETGMQKMGACPAGAQVDGPPLLSLLDEIATWYEVDAWRITGAAVEPPANNSRPVEATVRRVPESGSSEVLRLFAHEQLADDIELAVALGVETVVVGVRKVPKFADSEPYVSVGYAIDDEGQANFGGRCSRLMSDAVNRLSAGGSATPDELLRDYVLVGDRSALASALGGTKPSAGR